MNLTPSTENFDQHEMKRQALKLINHTGFVLVSIDQEGKMRILSTQSNRDFTIQVLANAIIIKAAEGVPPPKSN